MVMSSPPSYRAGSLTKAKRLRMSFLSWAKKLFASPADVATSTRESPLSSVI
jgi:hypothetical protein